MAGLSDGVSKVFICEHRYMAMNFDGYVSYEDAAEALLRRLWDRGAKAQIAALEEFKGRIDVMIEAIRSEESNDAGRERPND